MVCVVLGNDDRTSILACGCHRCPNVPGSIASSPTSVPARPQCITGINCTTKLTKQAEQHAVTELKKRKVWDTRGSTRQWMDLEDEGQINAALRSDDTKVQKTN